MVRVFAPFTPFLTEHMYQNLKKLVDWSKKEEETNQSVHYLMIPHPLNDLINEDIERSVSRMQSVIELGRVLRDRKTMPVKYPLPELIVIHTDQECLDDVKSLEVIFFFSYFFLATNCMVVTRHAGKTGGRRVKIRILGFRGNFYFRHKAPPIFPSYYCFHLQFFRPSADTE